MDTLTSKRIMIPNTWTVRHTHSPGAHQCSDFNSIHWLAADLGPTATQCLWHLANTPPQHPSDAHQLGEAVGVSVAVIYKQLNRLTTARHIAIDLDAETILVASHVPAIPAAKRKHRSDGWQRRYKTWLDRLDN